MSKIIGAGQTLALIESLRATVQKFKERGDKLAAEFRTRGAREALRRQAALDELATRHLSARNEATAALESARNTTAKRFQERKVRIDQAYQASQKAGLESVENKTGARKYELQKTMLQAERDHKSGLASTASEAQQFKTDLTAEETRLNSLEQNAQMQFRGYRRLKAAFFEAYKISPANVPQDHRKQLDQLRSSLDSAGLELERFRSALTLRLFRYPFLSILLAAGITGAVPVLRSAGITAVTYPMAAAGAVILVLAGVGTRFLAQKRAHPHAVEISRLLSNSRHLHTVCAEKSRTFYDSETRRIQEEYRSTAERVENELKRALAQAGEMRVEVRMDCDQRAVRAAASNERLHQARLKSLEARSASDLAELERNHQEQTHQLTDSSATQEQQLRTDHEARWVALQAEWDDRIRPLYALLNASTDAANALFPPWEEVVSADWKPHAEFSGAAKMGEITVDLGTCCGGLPADKRLALPGGATLNSALSLAYPAEGSLLLETSETGHGGAITSINNIILRLLAVSPPGRLNFSIIDPVGLGQNFAGVMHLADYEDQIINSRIWTQSSQIEQKLGDLNEHMEKVIQMYLRNEYQTITEYNAEAGVIAEKYYFLVVADFPVNFTETAVKRLLSIAASGARCGVYMLIHWDRRQPVPPEFIPEELRKSCFCLTAKDRDWILTGRSLPGATLRLDPQPAQEKAIEFIHRVGECSKDSGRVEVPFEHIAPDDERLWSQDTTAELRVAIGRTGATKLQYLALGKGTCQHGLVAGKTGSGKSTLFHVIVTNLALWCSPEQVEFYLVDFKKGVEFKCYASKSLPHARVVAIESDREFGLSVLERVDDELRRRGDLFRKLGVQDLPGYKRAGGQEKLPRCLLMIDEFQEFFVEDDKVSQTASLLLDRIVRQGRAFGIHVLLGSQTLGGAYTVARTTLGQMAVRIALQCQEADAYLIMDDTNPAPRLLSRPGEGIYNDSAGALAGNSPFQVVWLPDLERERLLERVRAFANRSGRNYPGPVVFEGNAPADIRENIPLRDLLRAPSIHKPSSARMWLGAPNSIKGPTEAVFDRQSGNNLLVIGQQDEAILGLVAAGLIALSAQFPRRDCRIIVCDSSPPDSPQRNYLEKVFAATSRNLLLPRQSELGPLLAEISGEMKQRAEEPESESAAPIFLFIHGLQRFAKLRYEEDFAFGTPDPDAPPNAAALLNSLVSESTRLGFHVIASCDSFNNVTRFLSRKALSEFEMRVLFQMSANDSASLIDNPKASTLGLHRALFYNEQEGHLETFRPYALPDNAWVEEVAASLSRSP